MDSIPVLCPYCFERIELLVDPETRGELVEDCEVCCNPWLLFVERDEDDQVSVTVDRLQ